MAPTQVKMEDSATFHDFMKTQPQGMDRELAAEFYRIKMSSEDEVGVLKGFACRTNAPESKASLPSCSKTCEICSTYYLLAQWQASQRYRYVHKLTDRKAAQIGQDHVGATKDNLAYLRSRLAKHGDEILSRWSKRTTAKRARLIKTALPDIYDKKGAQAELLKETTWAPGRENETAVLRLLHNRVFRDPSEWVAFDTKNLNTPFDLGALELCFNPHCVVMGKEDFGKLCQWTQDAAHRGEMIGYPRAQLVLEAQQRLSSFLRKLVDLIVPESHPQAKGKQKWDDLASAGFMVQGSSIAKSTYMNQAFNAPPALDLEHVLAMLESHRQAMEDELWSLQTSPSLARQKLRTVLDNPILRHLEDEKKQQRLLKAMLHGIERSDEWQIAIEEGERLRETMLTCQCNGDTGYFHSTEYHTALRLFESILSRLEIMDTNGLVLIAGEQENFSQHQAWEDNHLVMSDVTFESDPLMWNLPYLNRRPDKTGLETSFHFAFLDRILSQPAQKNRIDQTMYDLLSGMTATDEAITAVECHSQRCCGPPLSADEGVTIMLNRPENSIFRQRIHASNLWSQRMSSSLIEVWQALEKFINVPEPPSGSKEHRLQHFDASYEALSSFWATVYQCRKDVLIKARCSSGLASEYLAMLSASNSTMHQEEVKNERNALAHASQTKDKDDFRRESSPKLVQSIAAVQTQWGYDQPELNQPVGHRKLKVKTRRHAGVVASANEVNGSDSEEPSPPHVIPVSQASYSLFQRMYSSSAERDGEVRWVELVGAMVDAGCSATHNGGSGLAFKEQRSAIVVMFHRPHPDPHIDRYMLRFMGKRLERRFGWGQDSFVIREKISN